MSDSPRGPRFGFQLYSLRDIDDPLDTVIRHVGDAGVEGVEFAGVDAAGVAGEDPDDLRGALDATSVSAAGAHVDLAAIESEPAAVAATCTTLGCDRVVVPWLDPEHFRSAASVRRAAERLSAAADELSDHGLDLHYHNHDQEFVRVDGEYALHRLLALADGVGLEPDLGWAGAAGAEPLTLLSRYADRIDLLHLKDYDAEAGTTVPVGDGDIDLSAVADAASGHGIDWVIYEAEGGADTYDTLDAAAKVGASSFGRRS
ncbi:sugar phosphate isomerase/epimerase family protein [Halobaculum magnesiiphilum]|uniref:Sugar phosphate isomerase/epimerase n=1 Tax=Halobaculum magnesiiphilum TaxID=1017351 RepID=A0A8T8WHV2_9EURY|nr:sugar phosphate isomerase/epimerase [Halobaculum magnesiiphilum]QZP39439.1 sugar phosphate isomerase/epimerase [Halobaculum magnesiiphilum]